MSVRFCSQRHSFRDTQLSYQRSSPQLEDLSENHSASRTDFTGHDDVSSRSAVLSPPLRKSRGRWKTSMSVWSSSLASCSEDRLGLVNSNKSKLSARKSVKLEPKKPEHFVITSSLKKDYEAIVKGFVDRAQPGHKTMDYLLQDIADAIKARSKRENIPRYKFVVYSTALSKRDQPSAIQVSKSIWNPGTDTSCSIAYSNRDLWCFVTVYAVYME